MLIPVVSTQEPHPPRMSAENATRRQARLDSVPLNIFEQLTKLRPFVEVGPFRKQLLHIGSVHQ